MGSIPNQKSKIINIKFLLFLFKFLYVIIIFIIYLIQLKHAFYLSYDGRKVPYLRNYWNIVDWHNVEKIYEHTIKLS